MTIILLAGLLSAFVAEQSEENGRVKGNRKVARVWLIGDSTVADYSLEKDYRSKRYPIMGWGQVFQSFMASDSLKKIRHIIRTDSGQRCGNAK